jgi:3-hydroxyisobutyrate dehydrogenase
MTMLPAGHHVRSVYMDGVIPNASPSALLIDCSTIDVESARAVAAAAKEGGLRFADAPADLYGWMRRGGLSGSGGGA